MRGGNRPGAGAKWGSWRRVALRNAVTVIAGGAALRGIGWCVTGESMAGI
jgi:hypothetical protein